MRGWLNSNMEIGFLDSSQRLVLVALRRMMAFSTMSPSIGLQTILHASADVSRVPCARHEIVGVVTAVGAEVDDFKVGDLAGVGCMVESCRTCVLPVTGPHQQAEGFCVRASAALPAAWHLFNCAEAPRTYVGMNRAFVGLLHSCA